MNFFLIISWPTIFSIIMQICTTTSEHPISIAAINTMKSSKTLINILSTGNEFYTFLEKHLNKNPKFYKMEETEKHCLLKELTNTFIGNIDLISDNLFDLLFQALKSDNKLSEIQYLIINMLILQNKRQQNLSMFKVMTETQLLIALKSWSHFQQFVYLTEILEIFDIKINFVLEKNYCILFKHPEYLCKQPKEYQKEDESRLKIIIPYHVIYLINDLGNKKSHMAQYCIQALNTLFNLKEVVSVCLHNDRYLSYYEDLISPLNYFHKICPVESIHTLEINLYDSLQYLKIPQNLSFTKILENVSSWIFGTDESIMPILKPLKNLKKLKLKLIKPKEFESKIIFPDELYQSLETLIFEDMVVTEKVIEFLERFENLNNLIFEKICKIRWSLINQIQGMSKIKFKYFNEVDTVGIKVHMKPIQNIIITMHNKKIISTESNTTSFYQFKLCEVLKSLKYQLDIQSIKIHSQLDVDDFLTTCLNFPRLQTLDVNLKLFRIVSEICFPVNCPCYNTLTSLRMSFPLDENCIKLDFGNLETLVHLKELSIMLTNTENANIIGFKEDSAVLQNLTYLCIKLKKQAFNTCFKNLQAIKLQITTLELHIIQDDYEHYQIILDNQYLKKSLEKLKLNDMSKNPYFYFNLQGYEKIKTLELKYVSFNQSRLLKTLTQDKIINTLTKICFYGRVSINYEFMAAITEIYELRMSFAKPMFEIYSMFEENRFTYNNVKILRIYEIGEMYDFAKNIEILNLLFPNLRRLNIAILESTKQYIMASIKEKNLQLKFLVH